MSGAVGLFEPGVLAEIQEPDAPLVPVLVVDDNPAKRIALRAVLERLGCEIVDADSGSAALRCLMERDFAVILLDVFMPIMDGFETASLIRQRRQSKSTPIIFITGLAEDEIVRNEGYAEGAVDFMFAPLQPDQLRSKVSVFADLFARATRLAAQSLEFQRSYEQLHLLTEAAPIGIFRTDTQNRYLYTNPRWSEISGVPADVAFGRQWGSITEMKDGATIIPALPGQDVELAEFSGRFEIRSPDAEPQFLLITAAPFRDTEGEFAGSVGTLIDVTEMVGAESAMSGAMDQAAEASRLKSEFLANMSHEIRTPMNGVIGMTELLLETGLDERQRDYAQTVRSSVEALLGILNDILDFSKIEAGMLSVEHVEFDLRGLVYEVVDLLAGTAYRKGLNVIAVVEKEVPRLVEGDPGRLRQVITNLLGNAIKFTHIGEVVVRVSLDEGAGAESVVRFSISDTGDGIPPVKLGTLFQPFVQGDSSTSRKYGGTGLGLAISWQLVALMGGDCHVSSRLGAGSDFSFTIRVTPGPGDQVEVPEVQVPGLAGLAALIIDKSTTQRRALSDQLSELGMVPGTAESADAGLLAMRSANAHGMPFAVVVIDYPMLLASGIEISQAIAADPDIQIPMVLATSSGKPNVADIDPGQRVCEYLSKPVHPENLEASLRSALKLDAAGTRTKEVTTELPPFREKASGRLLVVDDNQTNLKVAVAMLTGAGYEVDTAVDGVAAVLAAASRSYDAILMDCQMPELDGYEATAAIRAQQHQDRHTPIIAMTAGARAEDRERAISAGMDDYLTKPIIKASLIALVDRSVRIVRSTSGDLEPVDQCDDEPVIDPQVVYELNALGEVTHGDLVEELFSGFVHDADLLLVELRQASELGAFSVALGIAHSIKGSASQLGGRRLASSCRRLEDAMSTNPLEDAQRCLAEVEVSYLELRSAIADGVS